MKGMGTLAPAQRLLTSTFEKLQFTGALGN